MKPLELYWRDPAAGRIAVRTVTGTSKPGQLPSILLVDDDEAHCSAIAGPLQSRRYNVTVTHDYLAALAAAEGNPPDFAVVALKFPGGLGLCFITKLRARSPRTQVVVLADYSSMATATAALQLGANYFLPKPASVEDIIAALHGNAAATSAAVSPDARAPSLRKQEWEHIVHVLTQNNGNISATARALGLYRRTLQRKLRKNPPRG